MQLEIPRSMLGYGEEEQINLEFKWADNYQGEDDIWSFYRNGDCAPYGRLNFIYGTLLDCSFARESREEAEKRPSPDGLKIKRWELEGKWSEDRVSDEGNEDGTYGPSRILDGNIETKWNPCTTENGGAGILFELNGTYTLDSIQCTFTAMQNYFDVYVSGDGIEYRPVASVNASNAGNCYDGDVCTVDMENAEGVKFVKLIFTGSNKNSLWINFMEFAIKDVQE